MAKQKFISLAIIILLLLLVLSVSCDNSSETTITNVASSSSGSTKSPDRPRTTWAIIGVETPPPVKPHQVTTDAEAIALAGALLISFNADWGRSTTVEKTVIGNYRIGYGKDERGVERVVLVDKETGQASFPFPR